MRPPQLKVQTDLRHPLWIPGQLYPTTTVHRLVQRGSHLANMDSAEPLPFVEGVANAPLFHDAFSAALDDYQAVHILQEGRVYFPFAFNLKVGQTVRDENDETYHVTKVLEEGGGATFNPYYRYACGQIVALDPLPEWDAVLRFEDASKLLYTSAFPNEAVVEYLQRVQLTQTQGVATRVLESQPFAGDNGIKERNGFLSQVNIRDPGNPHIQYEMREFRDLTTYEFTIFANKGWAADELLRYVTAVLRTYESSFRQLGIGLIFPAGRGPDAHVARGDDRTAAQSDLHIRRMNWQVRTSEALLTMQRTIDRLRIRLRSLDNRWTGDDQNPVATVQAVARNVDLYPDE